MRPGDVSSRSARTAAWLLVALLFAVRADAQSIPGETCAPEVAGSTTFHFEEQAGSAIAGAICSFVAFRCVPPEENGATTVQLLDPSCDPVAGPCAVHLRVPLRFPGNQLNISDGPARLMEVRWFFDSTAPACNDSVQCGQVSTCGKAFTFSPTIDTDRAVFTATRSLSCDDVLEGDQPLSLTAWACVSSQSTSCRKRLDVNGLDLDGPEVAAAIGCPPPPEDPPPWSCGEPNSCTECKNGTSVGGGGGSAGGGSGNGPFGPGAELRYLAGGAGRADTPGEADWRTVLGRYWAHDYAERIVLDPDDSHVWLITRWATFREFSDLVGGVYTSVAPSDEFRTLERTGTGWTLTDLDGSVTEFDGSGLWLSVTDRNGNAKTGTYTGGQLTSVDFPDGRREDFGYDGGGRLVSIAEVGTDGLTTRTWAYTWSGDDLVRIDRPDDTAWVMTYGDAAHPGYMTLLELEGTDGTSLRVEQGWEYDGDGNAVRTWRGAAAFGDAAAVDKWELAFDDPANPTVTTVTDPLGQQIVYTVGRDTVSDKPRVEAISGGCPGCGLESDTTFTYDPSHPLLPIAQEDAAGDVTAFTYTSHGQVETRTEAFDTPQERMTTFAYDATYSALVVEIEQPSTAGAPHVRRTTIGRNAAGDATSRTIEGIEAGSPFSLPTATAYNAAGQPLSIDPPGHGAADVTSFAYDGALGGLVVTSRTDPLVGTTTFDHDPFNRRTEVVDPNGVAATTAYDALNRVTESRQEGAQPADDLVTAHAYTVFGDLAQTTLPAGNAIEYGYDAAGRLVRIERRSADGTERERTLYLLDGAGNRIAEELQSWNGVAWEVKSFTDFEYASRCQLGRVLHADGTATRYDYTCDGHLAAVWDANHPFVDPVTTPPTEEYAYDALDRLIEVRRPWAGSGGGDAVTAYSYDVQDHLTAVTDAEGNTTTYAYSDRDLMTEEISPASGTSTHAYDEHGELISTTDARGITLTRTVDAADRVTLVDYPGADLDATHTYGTDPLLFEVGRLTGIERGGETVAYAYDRFGRTTADGDLSYGYDENGNRTLVGYPGGVAASYTFDFADREATLTVTSPAGMTPVVTVSSYLPSGPLAALSLGNGVTETRAFTTRYFPQSIALDAARDRGYAYTTDAVGNVTSITETVECLADVVLENRSVTGSEAHQSCDQVLAGPALTVEDGASLTLRAATSVVLRDGFSVATGATFSAGNDPTLDGGTWTYGYQDIDYFLTSATGPWGDLAWTYDRIGNRLGETRDGWTDAYAYTPNGTNGNTPLLASIALAVGGTRTFTHGPAGHLTQVAASGNVVDLTYDAEGRLSLADRLGNTTDFTYDGRSYLAEAGEEDGPLGATRPTYSSDGLLHALTQRATGSDPGEAHHLFHFAGRPVAQLSTDAAATETWLYLTTDHLGTPLVATDAAGAEVWAGPFEPFGRDRWAGTNLGASEEDVFLRFPGQWDDEVWLEAMRGADAYYNLHRWYQPAMGRYTRPDPLGLEAGLNLYVYVEGNPLNYFDPRGLAIYICSRKAFITGNTPNGVGNHSYLWDDRDGVPPDQRYCGVWSNAPEQGPAVDACNYVPGSDGREDRVMQCCRFEKKHPGLLYIPFINDCQTGTYRALDCAGLTDENPGVPGARMGLPCDQCSVAPPPRSEPPPMPGLFGSPRG